MHLHSRGLKEYRAFCRKLGLKEDEVKHIDALLEELSSVVDIEDIDFNEIKEKIKVLGGGDKLALVAYAILKEFVGDNLVYLLLGALTAKPG